jgi:chaperonin cofactor prefoldin
MAMMTSGWTDERMDDLKHQVDEIGRRMETGFAAQRQELNVRLDRMEAHLDKRFEVVDRQLEVIYERFDKIDERFDRVDERFDIFS